MKDWRLTILQIFAQLGDKATLRDIYARLEESGQLAEADNRQTRHDERSAYPHAARISVLKEYYRYAKDDQKISTG